MLSGALANQKPQKSSASLQLHRHQHFIPLTHTTLSSPHHLSTHCRIAAGQHDLRRTTGNGIGAARYVCTAHCCGARQEHNTDIFPAKPITALQPLRAANAAFISSSSQKSAATEPTSTSRFGLIQNAPGSPPPMKTITGKQHREVPLPSQEGTKGVMQYALYVGMRRDVGGEALTRYQDDP